MISSALRLKAAVELPTNVSITFSSTPDSASLMTSAVAPVGRIFGGGAGVSEEIVFTGASEMSSPKGCSAEAGSNSVAGGAKAADCESVFATAAVSSGELEACCKQPPARGRISRRASLALHFQNFGFFIRFVAGPLNRDAPDDSTQVEQDVFRPAEPLRDRLSYGPGCVIKSFSE